jgi:hypothetical protein
LRLIETKITRISSQNGASLLVIALTFNSTISLNTTNSNFQMCSVAEIILDQENPLIKLRTEVSNVHIVYTVNSSL